MSRFKPNNFFSRYRPKIRLFLQKNTDFLSAGSTAARPMKRPFSASQLKRLKTPVFYSFNK